MSQFGHMLWPGHVVDQWWFQSGDNEPARLMQSRQQTLPNGMALIDRSANALVRSKQRKNIDAIFHVDI